MRALILLSLVIATPAFAADRVDLFDSKTLQGWRQQNGTVTYRDVDGAVVGKTSEASPNSILCTTRDYGDFEMESDVKVHDRLNTGIMICAREREKSRRRGSQQSPRPRQWPQVEIEASGAKGAEAGYAYSVAAGRGYKRPSHSHPGPSASVE